MTQTLSRRTALRMLAGSASVALAACALAPSTGTPTARAQRLPLHRTPRRRGTEHHNRVEPAQPWWHAAHGDPWRSRIPRPVRRRNLGGNPDADVRSTDSVRRKAQSAADAGGELGDEPGPDADQHPPAPWRGVSHGTRADQRRCEVEHPAWSAAEVHRLPVDDAPADWTRDPRQIHPDRFR